MEFEWDEVKNRANVVKHGLEFRDAVAIFDGRVLRRVDDRHDYGETRVLATGIVDGKETTVIYTKRWEIYRIISARRAHRNERRAYRAILHSGTTRQDDD
jgi:uncharacterized DUF497 family protein